MLKWRHDTTDFLTKLQGVHPARGRLTHSYYVGARLLAGRRRHLRRGERLRQRPRGRPGPYSVPVSVQGSTIEAPSHHAQRTLRQATGVNVPLSGLAEVRVRSGERDNPRGELYDFVATATRGEIAAVINAQPSRHSRLVWVPMSRLEELADHDVFRGLKERSREALWKARTSGQISWPW